MPLTISDTWLDYSGSGIPIPRANAAVFLVPTQSPVFLRAGAPGSTLYQLLASDPPGVATDAAGVWSIDVPWPSETPLNPGLTWQLVLPDRTLYGGAASDGLTGPLTLAQLLSPPYSWGMVAGGLTVTSPIITALPNTAFLAGQAIFPGFTGGPETITAVPNPDGSLTITYASMGASATLRSNPDGSTTITFSGSLSHTVTITSNPDGSVTQTIT